MLMLLAGRSAIGTEAACRVATEPKLLERMITRLNVDSDVNLNDHRKAFWAAVVMERDPQPPHETRLDSVKVVQAEYFSN